MIPLGELAVFGLVGVMALGWRVVMVWAYWKILERVGYDRRWSLLVLVPAFGNHGLWASLHLFLIARGLTLLAILPRRARTTFR